MKAPVAPTQPAQWLPAGPFPAASLRFHLFAIIFALGVLNHELAFMLEQQTLGPLADYMERWRQVRPLLGWPSAWAVGLHLADVALTVAIVALPWRRALTASLAVPSLLTSFTITERLSSHHSLMAAALSLVLVLALAELCERLIARAGWRERARTDWERWTRLGLQWALVLTYGFAALHKLNTDWLSLRDGSGAAFVGEFASQYGLPARQAVALLGYPAIYGTILLEATLPLLLLYRPTRLGACLVGLLFHLAMMVRGITDFTTLILAFYPLFMSEAQARELIARCRSKPSPARLVALLVLTCVAVIGIQRSNTFETFSGAARQLDPVMLMAFQGLTYITLAVSIHVALTLGTWLAENRARQTIHPQPVAASAG